MVVDGVETVAFTGSQSDYDGHTLRIGQGLGATDGLSDDLSCVRFSFYSPEFPDMIDGTNVPT